MKTAESKEVWTGSTSLRPLLVPIDSLRESPDNARAHGDRSYLEIGESLRQFGQRKPIVVKNGTVAAGNGTLEAARRQQWTHIAVADADDLSERELRAYAIADNRTAELSEWNQEQLSKDLPDLSEFNLGFNSDEVIKLLSAVIGSDAPTYTAKITSPIYAPGDEKPDVSLLLDRSKTSVLVEEINAADIPDDVARFLRAAAERHTVFNFKRIADFYAHSDSATQLLFEKSALVIIDFNQAIENGYVRLTRKIGQFIAEEIGESDAG